MLLINLRRHQYRLLISIARSSSRIPLPTWRGHTYHTEVTTTSVVPLSLCLLSCDTLQYSVLSIYSYIAPLHHMKA